MDDTRAFPGFEHLYEISDPFASRALRGDFDTPEDALKLTRAEASPTEPVHVNWFMGGAVPWDVIWTGMAIPLIISNRVVEILRENGFTGWDTYSVEVRNKNGEVVEGYFGLAIHGRCGLIDYSKSEIVPREFPGGWFPQLKGEFFDPSSWDGSDFLMESPDEHGHVTGKKYVSGRVRKALRKGKVANILFERLSDRELDLSVIEIGLGYRLPKDIGERIKRAYSDMPSEYFHWFKVHEEWKRECEAREHGEEIANE